MARKNLNTNKFFMLGNGLLAFAVFVIVAVFIYLSFRYERKDKAEISFKGVYQIEVSADFSGDSIAFYLNDSLLLDKVMPDAPILLSVNRFAEQSALLVVDRKTDKATPFTLSDEGSHIKVSRNNGVIYIIETEK